MCRFVYLSRTIAAIIIDRLSIPVESASAAKLHLQSRMTAIATLTGLLFSGVESHCA